MWQLLKIVLVDDLKKGKMVTLVVACRYICLIKINKLLLGVELMAWDS